LGLGHLRHTSFEANLKTLLGRLSNGSSGQTEDPNRRGALPPADLEDVISINETFQMDNAMLKQREAREGLHTEEWVRGGYPRLREVLAAI